MIRNFTSLNHLLFLVFLLSTQLVNAQNVGVNPNGATPDVSAMLDIVNGNKGLLIPRVSLTSITDAATIATPANSLLVFNTNSGITGGQGSGYYYNSGTTVAPLWLKLSASSEAWLLRGNSGINDPAVPATYGTSAIGAAENFLGTTDAQDVVFGTNNIERMRVKQTSGNIGIGTASPAAKLDILAPGGSIGLQLLSGNTSQLSYLSVGRTIEYAQIGACTNGTFFTDAVTGDMAVKNFNSGKLLLGSSYIAKAAMSVVPGGNVGINTVNPYSKLDDSGDIALREGPALVIPAATTYPTFALSGTEFSHYRLTGATIPFSLYYITGGNDGQILTLINTTGQKMTLYNYNFANGILTGTGGNITLNSTFNSTVTMIYNATLGRWVVTSYTGSDGNYWRINGNTGITSPAAPATYGTTLIGAAENWAGTTDANDYVLGTNNVERLRVKQTTGNVGIGIAAPLYKLHVVNPVSYAIAGLSENTYAGNADGTGFMGRANNAPGYGYGGQFQGGYMGSYNYANSTTYTGYGYGTYSIANGSAGTRIGGYFSGSGGTYNYGVIVPGGGGLSGFGTTVPQQRVSVQEGLNVDQADANPGSTANALTFGNASGEGVGSKRTAGGNQFGLDFYQGYANRMRIWNNGNVAIGQTSAGSLTPAANLTVWNPLTTSQTSDIPVFTAKHSGSSGTTWQMGSIEYYTEGEANIGFTYQICPLNGDGSASLGSPSASKYFGYRWSTLYTTTSPNISSDTTLKKNIKPVEYGLSQLRKINTIAYKMKNEKFANGQEIKDEDKRVHLGFNAQELRNIIPEVVSSWDWMTMNEKEYIKTKTPTLGVFYDEMIPVVVNAVKELDKQQQAVIKTINLSDFGTDEVRSTEATVVFSDEFRAKLQGKPVVTVTPMEAGASLYIAAVTEEGFTVRSNIPGAAVTFSWMAMAKIKEDALEMPSPYSEEQHAKKLQELNALEAKLPSNADALQMNKALIQSQEAKSVLTAEQEKMKQEAEKVKAKTKILEQQAAAEQQLLQERWKKSQEAPEQN